MSRNPNEMTQNLNETETKQRESMVPIYVTATVRDMLRRLADLEERSIGRQVAQLVKTEYRTRELPVPEEES